MLSHTSKDQLYPVPEALYGVITASSSHNAIILYVAEHHILSCLEIGLRGNEHLAQIERDGQLLISLRMYVCVCVTYVNDFLARLRGSSLLPLMRYRRGRRSPSDKVTGSGLF